MEMKGLFISLLFFFALFYLSAGKDTECVYFLFVKTSNKFASGTNANIQAAMDNKINAFVAIGDLKQWGIMKSGHNYFGRSKLDIFVVRGVCIDIPICRIRMMSDGKGLFSTWHLEYVEVTSGGLGKSCNKTHFDFDKKLSKKDPVAEVDLCDNTTSLYEPLTNQHGFIAI